MKNLLIIGAISVSALANAQSVPNGGFETWTNNGFYEDPNEWTSLNMLGILFGVETTVVSKSTDAHTGTYSAKVETIAADLDGNGDDDTLPGSMYLGTLDFMSETATNGAAFAYRPDSLTGFFKYAPVNGDMWAVQVTLTKWNAANQSADVIGTAEFVGMGAESAFTRFSTDIEYLMPDMPDSVQIMVMASGGMPSPGTALWIDDLSFVTNSTADAPELSAAPLIQYYPNPASHSLTVIAAKSTTIDVYNALGLRIDTVKAKAGEKTTLRTDEYRNGVYFLKTEAGDLERFVVQH